MLIRLLRAVPALVLLAALTPLTGRAQTTPATLSGQVADDAGRVLAGASVALYDASGTRMRHGTAADAQGAFRVDRVEPGRYRVRVSYLGYAPFAETVELAAGADRRLDVVLAEHALPQDEVLVTASRARAQLTPVTFTNMTAQRLAELPEMKDLPVHLATTPSVTFYSENGNGIGYSYLRMRGFDQRRVAVSVNGVPQNDPESHNVFWINFFDLQGAVEDIQVQRGAGASFYGPAGIGGAINIVANPYRPYPYARVELGYGSYDTQRYTVEANSGLLDDRWVAHARFSRLLSDGYRDWSWSEYWRFFAGVTRYGDRHTVTLQAYGGPQYDGLAYYGIPKSANEDDEARRANFAASTEDVESFHQPHVELHHEWRPSEAVDVDQTLFWIKGEGYFDFGSSWRSANYLRLPQGFALDVPETCYGSPVNPDADPRTLPLDCTMPGESVLFRAYLDQWQLGWLPRATYRHGLGETTVGLEARLHRSLNWGRVQEAPGLPDAVVGEADYRVYQARGEKAIASAFASHLARPHDMLAVQGDLQVTYRHYRIYDEAFVGTEFTTPYVFVNPRLGVTLAPERPLSAWASVAYASREPRMNTLYDVAEAGAGETPQFETRADGSYDFDRPVVGPEHLVDFELGVGLRGERVRASVNGFWMAFRDEIVPSGGVDRFGVPRTGNAERTRHVGLELEGAARMLPGLDVYGNATFSRNRHVHFSEFETDWATGEAVELVRDGNPIAGFPDVSGSAGISFERSGFSFRADMKAAGRQYIDNSGARAADGVHDDALTVDPYTLVDAGVGYTFHGGALDGLNVRLDVNNVLDARVLTFGNESGAFFPAATRHFFVGMRYTIR